MFPPPLFVGLHVCLFVRKVKAKTRGGIPMKLVGRMCYESVKKPLKFGVRCRSGGRSRNSSHHFLQHCEFLKYFYWHLRAHTSIKEVCALKCHSSWDCDSEEVIHFHGMSPKFLCIVDCVACCVKWHSHPVTQSFKYSQIVFEANSRFYLSKLYHSVMMNHRKAYNFKWPTQALFTSAVVWGKNQF